MPVERADADAGEPGDALQGRAAPSRWNASRAAASSRARLRRTSARTGRARAFGVSSLVT
ncbi:hypothetical protein LUX33_02940 [Actinomadura madurae]|uniref:hypothetical protein n=1 Tax=Actinomadura madurae TaxID=1993 RepID=UPI0020D22287|nr:hypothetical protein [Actinomadura madurae]MCP9947513.1 hypothetical protein [Actinomadura madurae]